MQTTEQVRSRRAAAADREGDAAAHVPYERHLTPSIVQTTLGDLVCVLRVSGAAFECASNSEINTRHARLNRVLVNLGDPRVTLWQHIIKRVVPDCYPDGDFPPGYAREFDARYREAITRSTLMSNELYLAVVYRPKATMARGLATVLGALRSLDDIAVERARMVADMDSIVNGLIASLGHYEAERLGMYQHEGLWFSAPAELFAYLHNGVWERVAVERFPLKYGMVSARPRFKNETVEVRGPTSSVFSAMLGVNRYPSQTPPGFLDSLLSVPCELVVTQSFSFKVQDSALNEMGRTQGKMENAGDPARSQIEELPEAADALASNRLVMGGQHYSIEVKAGSMDELPEHVDTVRAVLTNAGIKSAREDLACEGAWYARLPGVFDKRKRLSTIHSGNAGGFMPLHNYPAGRRDGNHWGPALAMLKTAAGTPFYLNLHASDPKALNGGGKKDVGHTYAIGPNGSGKTAAAMFCLAQAQKYRPTTILFSKDRDSEIAARMLGGVVQRADPGVPLFNLFGLDPLERRTHPHLRRMVRKLANPAPSDEKALDQAVARVLRLEPSARRLGRVLDYLPSGPMYDRLAKWCYARPHKPGTRDGVHAWVFDNPVDAMTAGFGSAATTVFDITNFIDDDELRGPLIAHLFFLTRRLADGRRLAVFVAEAWKLLGDPQAAYEGKDFVKTVRKKNGFLFLDSNSLSDILGLSIGRTLLEQVATLLLFPNPAAERAEHMEGGLGLTQRQFDLIKTELPEGQGYFLMVQGHHSVVLQLPLGDLPDDLAVLSARTSNLALMDRLIKQHGADPAAWYPHFQQQRRTA
jgi:type IV secretion system protein VirB4